MTQASCSDQQRDARFSIDGSSLTLHSEGPSRLAALRSLIDGSQQRLDLCFYIFGRDACAVEIRDALVDACHRGVAVTLLIDAFGSAMTPGALFKPLIEAGANVGWFGTRRTTRYLIRNHQKMIIADQCRAMVGGFNVAADYFASEDEPQGWRDFGLRIEGPLVGELQRWFDGLAAWTLDGSQSFRALRRMVRDWRPGTGRAVWLMGGPTHYLNGWARHVKHDIQAGHRLDLVAAYFSPGWAMVRKLGRLARAGSARIVTPAKSDNRATIGAARHIYKRLLRAGVSVYEYRPQKLHAKLLVIDDITYIGSANFDMRSLFLNVELMLRIEDAGFADAIRAEVDAVAVQSQLIDQAAYQRMAGPLSKLRWWFDYLLVGVLDYTVTRRLLRRPSADD
jgi:cardiolipin synthase A/B